MFANDEDTIFAPASGAGRAAIAVVRLSGPGCSAALQAIAPGAEFRTAALCCEPCAILGPASRWTGR